eukprot:jgi/Chlat1/5261/Chrsp33S05097
MYVLERQFSLDEKVVYFAYAIRANARDVLWTLLVLVAWVAFLDVPYDHWLLHIGTRNYFARIHAALFNQYVLEALSGPPLVAPDNNSSTNSPHHPHITTFQQIVHKAHVAVVRESRTRDRVRSAPDLLNNITPEDLVEPQPNNNNNNNIVATGSVATDIDASTSGSGGGTHANVVMRSAGSKTEKGGSTTKNTVGDGDNNNINAANNNKDSVANNAANANTSMPISLNKLFSLSSSNVTLRGMKDLIKFVRKSGVSTHVSLLQDEDEEGLNAGDGEADATQSQLREITSAKLAKVAARKLFAQVARNGREVTKGDLARFLPKEHVDGAWELFDKSPSTSKRTHEAGQQVVTRHAIAAWAVNVYRERLHLARTLSDRKIIVAQLRRVLEIITLVICAFLWMFALGFDTTRVVLAISSWVFLIGVTVGPSIRTVVESILFLFSVVVQEIGLVHTLFEKDMGDRMYYPNQLLWTKPIINYNRSPNQLDEILLQINSITTEEKLDALRAKIRDYLAKNSAWWHPDFTLAVQGIENSWRMKIGIYQRHKMNFQLMGERYARRACAILAYKKFMEELGIGFDQPIQHVAMHENVPMLRSGSEAMPRTPRTGGM